MKIGWQYVEAFVFEIDRKQLFIDYHYPTLSITPLMRNSVGDRVVYS